MATKKRSTNDVASLAQQVARELLETRPALKTAQPVERDTAIALAFRAEEGSVARLMAAFRGDASFGHLHTGWIQQRGGSGMPAQGLSLPPLFVARAIDGRSVKSLINKARAFGDSPGCVTESYTALTGFTVARPVGLSQGVHLIPWSDVPESKHKTRFDSEASPMFPAMRAVPNAALRSRSPKGQVLFSSYEEAQASLKDWGVNSVIPTAQTDDLLRCITVQSMRRVAPVGSWIQLDNEIADAVGPGFYSLRPGAFDHGLWQLSKKPAVISEKDIGRIFHLFADLKPADKDVMRIALDRLGRALRQQKDVDNAIELGIALEVMLLHGINNNDRGELKFRLAVRGATFLGGDKPQRMNNFKLLKDVYDLRSKAVHAGRLGKGMKGSPPRDILERGKSTCAQIALRLIERGSFPNWDDEFVIGSQ